MSNFARLEENMLMGVILQKLTLDLHVSFLNFALQVLSVTLKLWLSRRHFSLCLKILGVLTMTLSLRSSLQIFSPSLMVICKLIRS